MAGVLAAIKKAEAESASRLASTEAGARRVLAKYGSIIDRYRGDIPASMVATRIQRESSGNPKARVSSTGEAGLLMLWKPTQEKYNVTNPYDPAQNIRGGLLHWQTELGRMRSKLPGLFPSRNLDYFAIGQLYTSIGGGATPYLLKKAGVRPGHEYSDLVAWLKQTGEGLEKYRPYFGTQSAALVARRIITAGFMTQVADRIGGLGNGGLFIVLGAAVLTGFLVQKFWK